MLGRTTLLSGGGVVAWSSISFRYIVAKDDLDISTIGTNVLRGEGCKPHQTSVTVGKYHHRGRTNFQSDGRVEAFIVKNVIPIKNACDVIFLV